MLDPRRRQFITLLGGGAFRCAPSTLDRQLPAGRGRGLIVTRCSNFALRGVNKQSTIPRSSTAGTSLIQIAFSRAGGIKLDRQLSAK
jgi:hypothetical protein